MLDADEDHREREQHGQITVEGGVLGMAPSVAVSMLTAMGTATMNPPMTP